MLYFKVIFVILIFKGKQDGLRPIPRTVQIGLNLHKSLKVVAKNWYALKTHKI